MLERTYRARHMGDALMQIKRDLGPDAVILSSREVRDPARTGPSTSVEVTAAPYGVLALDGLGASGVDRQVQKLERNLLRGGVPANAVRTLVMHVRRQMRERPLPLVDALSAAMRAEVAFAPPSPARVVALVGPTGVGKTTTVAKLAAISALVNRRRTALVCLDQYRVGASEQLARYADLIGIPMECASDAPSVARALHRLADADRIYIDTSGRSPRDALGLAKTAEALRGASEPVEVHMCVAAATREVELCAMLDHFGVNAPSRVLVTKLDEAVHCGGALAAYVHSGLPLSYLTTGQRVPEDIEVASAEALAGVMCGEEVQ